MPTGHWNSHPAARGALKHGLLGNILSRAAAPHSRPEIIEVIAQPEDDLFGVQNLSRVECGTVFRAASALDTTEGLQRVDARDVLAGIESEILIAHQRWNAAEALAAQKNRGRA